MLGLYLSLNFDLPTGAAIAAIAGVGFFVVASLVSMRHARGPLRPAVTIAVVALGAVAFAGCGTQETSSTTPGGESRIKVVATTPQIADIIRGVGGQEVDVTTLLPDNADPHEFEPKPRAVAAISNAAVVFRSGGDIDAWILPAVKAASIKAAPVDLSRSAVLLPAGDGSKGFNAHWYLAPQNIARATQRVRDELIKSEPSLRETFRANATESLNEIDAADRQLQRCAAKVPDQDRNLLADHNDFAYLAEAFGFKIAAQLAANGESEPSASELQAAVDRARAADVRSVVASRGEITKLDEAVAKKLSVPLLPLYADTLSMGGNEVYTLLGAIEYDVDQIASAATSGDVRCKVVD